MVTAELAVAMPLLAAVLALALGVVRLGVDEVRCVDAARLAARALARGDHEGSARAQAARAAPAGALVIVRLGGSDVSVDVTVSRDVPGLHAFTVGGTATARREAS